MVRGGSSGQLLDPFLPALEKKCPPLSYHLLPSAGGERKCLISKGKGSGPINTVILFSKPNRDIWLEMHIWQDSKRECPGHGNSVPIKD